MANRKTIITAFLLIAVMVLGVGYAAVSDTLNFSGDATVSDTQVQHEFDADIMIVAVSEDNSTWIDYTPSTIEINRTDDLIVNIIDGAGDNVQDQIDFQIYNLADAGDTQVIWFRVKNDSAHDAKLTCTEITETGSDDYFTSNYKVYDANGTTETNTIPANGTILVKLVITLNSTPTELYKANFSFAIDAVAGANNP